MGNIQRNENQRELMAYVFERFEAGTPATIKELRLKFAPGITKPAFTCRLRFLMAKGMIVRVIKPKRIYEIHPTREGYAWFRNR